MAVGGEVWTDATVGSVGSSTSLDGSLDNDVGNNAFVSIESLSFSVSFKVDKEFLDSLTGFLWPATEWQSVYLSLGSSSNTSIVLSEWNDCGMSNNSIHMLDSCVDFHALAETSNFITILVVRSQVRDSALCGYKRNKIKTRITYILLAQLAVWST